MVVEMGDNEYFSPWEMNKLELKIMRYTFKSQAWQKQKAPKRKKRSQAKFSKKGRQSRRCLKKSSEKKKGKLKSIFLENKVKYYLGRSM